MEQHDKKEIENDHFDFMKEQIKDRPVNKKKLLRKTVITVSMAGVFGLVACFTFLLLEPVFNNWLYPEEEKVITFPTEEEEMQPEDMLQEEIAKPTPPVEAPVVEKKELQIADYQLLYSKLHSLVKVVEKSVVTVTGVTSDVDWFNDTYENKGQVSGIIIADGGKDLLILVMSEAIQKADSILITFCDGSQSKADIKSYDSNTGLSVLTVAKESMVESTLASIAYATLGSSNGTGVLATPVMVVGSPLGTSGSIAYGMITAAGNSVEIVDHAYKAITTDIYGSQNASGILVDMRGQVIGIINQKFNAQDMKNMLTAIGITELKTTIEKLSNAKELPYMGVFVADVTPEASSELGVPFGAYVKEILMDSPAMECGIQNADVIIAIGSQEIKNSRDFVTALEQTTPSQLIPVVVMRQGQEGYQEMTCDMTVGSLK